MIRALKGERLFWIMLVQIAVGYAWLASAVDKLRSASFLPGLPDKLGEMSEETKYGWYRRFLEDGVIPNAELFGQLVTWGELLVGISLIVLAAFLVVRGTADRWALPASATAAVALLVGVFMNVNFHLAEGYFHPFIGYSDGLEGSVDLDSLMPLVQLVLLGVNLAIAWSGRPQVSRVASKEVILPVLPWHRRGHLDLPPSDVILITTLAPQLRKRLTADHGAAKGGYRGDTRHHWSGHPGPHTAERSLKMRRKIGMAMAGLLAAMGLFAGVGLAVGLQGTASAGDPPPPPGMHQACETMAPEAMDRMHEGMMNAGGQMGEWMGQNGQHCPHQ